MSSPSTIVSVIIPTYNRALLLSRALKSVVNQSYTYWEIIVVDNHSHDNTDEVVQGFNDSRIKILKINNNGIIAKSRNKGVKLSKGEWIAFLDSDDWWLENKLEISLNYLDQGADLTYHDLWKIDSHGDGQTTLLKTRQLNKHVFEDLLVCGNTIPNSSVVVKKKMLEQIAGLNEKKEMIAVEDYDAWLRISKFTDKYIKVPGVLGY